MRINCESCGSTINIEKDHVCPGCKAPYDKNKEYLEYKEQKKREELLSFRQKETVTNLAGTVAEKFAKPNPMMKIVPIFAFIVIVVIAVIAFNIIRTSANAGIEMKKIPPFDTSEFEKSINGFFKKKEYTEHEVFVDEVTKEKLTVDCDKYAIAESNKEGYNEIVFHITVHNNSTVSKVVGNVNCAINDVAQKTTLNLDYEELHGFVDAGLTIEGYKSFFIPKDTTEVDLIVESAKLHIKLQ